MIFEEKEVKRAVRDFDFIVQAISLAENKGLYLSRLRSLFSIIKMNDFLEEIFSPYLEMDPEEIENGDWFYGIEINLPADLDLEIAYVLQSAEKLSNDNKQVEFMISNVFSEQRETPVSIETIQHWSEQLLMPTLEKISNELNDLIEDKVQGKKTITLEEIKFKK